MKNKTTFHIKGLNQEQFLSKLCKNFQLFDIVRKSKNETVFSCSFFNHKKVDKELRGSGFEILEIKHHGIFHQISKILTSYGLIVAFFAFFLCFFIQNQYILQYEINGEKFLSEKEIVEFVKENYPKKKSKIDTSAVEVALSDEFERISFVSCIIKGQTLVINIKEKLFPDEMYDEFAPLVAVKSGKITKIDLISGTLNVKVGDFVQVGDALVEPYVIDTAGNIKKVLAKANIVAEVYYEGQSVHDEVTTEVVRTGKFVEESYVSLFGLDIYCLKQEHEFALFETEQEDYPLIKNLVLPFKLRKIKIYELQKNEVKTKFDDVKEKFIEKAHEKALANCKNYDKMIDEFYTIRHISSRTFVNFCIVTQETVGGFL